MIEAVFGGRVLFRVSADPDCNWMFYNRTLNRSRRFCSASSRAAVIRVRRFLQAEKHHRTIDKEKF